MEIIWNKKIKTMVKYIKEGNIFNIEGVMNYAHGCNCAGAGATVTYDITQPGTYCGTPAKPL